MSINKLYECSSKGNKEFSAFYAILKDGKSIEYHDQVNVKGYDSIKLGKGKPPLNSKTIEQCKSEYKELWLKYFKSKPWLLKFIKRKIDQGYILNDMFAHGGLSQAGIITEIVEDKNE